jgi:hypothetical protein
LFNRSFFDISGADLDRPKESYNLPGTSMFHVDSFGSVVKLWMQFHLAETVHIGRAWNRRAVDRGNSRAMNREAFLS